MSSSNVDKKTIWFEPHVWLMLQSLTRISGVESPSHMVAQLVKGAYPQVANKKSPANGRTPNA